MAEFELETPQGTFRVTAENEQQAYNALMKMLNGQAEQPEQPGLLERAGRWLTGANREESIPGPTGIEGGMMTPQQAARATALFATTQDPQRLRAGLQLIEPDVQFQQDSYGNDVALWPRKDANGNITGYNRFYPNPAGLDVGDVMRGAGVVSSALGVGKLAQLLGLPLRGVTGGATLGGLEAGVTEGASALASGQPFNKADVVYGAAGGVLGEKAGQVVQQLVGLARSAGPQAVVDASGNLLPRYADIVRRAGLDPDQISAQVAADMATMVRGGVPADEAAATAMSRGLPTPIPLTRGQLTGNKGQQLFEDMAASGAAGDLARVMMETQQRRTQDALTSNLDQLLERLNPAGAPIQRGAGGAAAQASLVGQREVAKAAANDLYTAARATSAVIAPDASEPVSNAMRTAFRAQFNPISAPGAAAMLDEFDRVAATGDINQIMSWREQMSSLRKGGPTVDAAAVEPVLQAFDREIAVAVDQALLSGDVAAAEAWGKAIKNYSEFASTWKSKGGILNSLTGGAMRDGSLQLKVAPEAAADYIFTTTASGLANKTGLARDLVTLKTRLPAQEWDMLRQEAFLRLMDTSKGAVRGGERQTSGINFFKAWADLRDKNPGVVNSLFTKDERDLITQFATVAARATGGAVNSSNSASAFAGLIPRMMQAFGNTNLTQFLIRVPLARGLTEAAGGARAIAATRGMPRPATPITTGGAVAGGVAASSPAGQNEIDARIRAFMGQPR